MKPLNLLLRLGSRGYFVEILREDTLMTRNAYLPGYRVSKNPHQCMLAPKISLLRKRVCGWGISGPNFGVFGGWGAMVRGLGSWGLFFGGLWG